MKKLKNLKGKKLTTADQQSINGGAQTNPSTSCPEGEEAIQVLPCGGVVCQDVCINDYWHPDCDPDTPPPNS